MRLKGPSRPGWCISQEEEPSSRARHKWASWTRSPPKWRHRSDILQATKRPEEGWGFCLKMMRLWEVWISGIQIPWPGQIKMPQSKPRMPQRCWKQIHWITYWYSLWNQSWSANITHRSSNGRRRRRSQWEKTWELSLEVPTWTCWRSSYLHRCWPIKKQIQSQWMKKDGLIHRSQIRTSLWRQLNFSSTKVHSSNIWKWIPRSRPRSSVSFRDFRIHW